MNTAECKSVQGEANIRDILFVNDALGFLSGGEFISEVVETRALEDKPEA